MLSSSPYLAFLEKKLAKNSQSVSVMLPLDRLAGPSRLFSRAFSKKFFL